MKQRPETQAQHHAMYDFMRDMMGHHGCYLWRAYDVSRDAYVWLAYYA